MLDPAPQPAARAKMDALIEALAVKLDADKRLAAAAERATRARLATLFGGRQ